MCFGFGGWITRSGEVVFGLPDRFGNCSHVDAMNKWYIMYRKYRKQLDHVPDFGQDWEPFEFPNWTRKSFHWEVGQDWIEPCHKAKVMEAFKKVRKIYRKFYPHLVLYGNSLSAERRELEDELVSAYDRMVDEMKQVEGCVYDIPYAYPDVRG